MPSTVPAIASRSSRPPASDRVGHLASCGPPDRTRRGRPARQRGGLRGAGRAGRRGGQARRVRLGRRPARPRVRRGGRVLRGQRRGRARGPAAVDREALSACSPTRDPAGWPASWIWAGSRTSATRTRWPRRAPSARDAARHRPHRDPRCRRLERHSRRAMPRPVRHGGRRGPGVAVELWTHVTSQARAASGPEGVSSPPRAVGSKRAGVARRPRPTLPGRGRPRRGLAFDRLRIGIGLFGARLPARGSTTVMRAARWSPRWCATSGPGEGRLGGLRRHPPRRGEPPSVAVLRCGYGDGFPKALADQVSISCRSECSIRRAPGRARTATRGSSSARWTTSTTSPLARGLERTNSW